MTREEAIGMIKDDMRLHHDYLSGNYRKALRIAISALEQQKIIRCKDCDWWTKQGDSLQGRCDRYGTYPTGYWYCAAARERREG